MGLSLSTYAAPEMPLEALQAACHGRGLEGVEWVLEEGADLASFVAGVQRAQLSLVALRVERLGIEGAAGLARASRQLGVPVSVPSGAVDDLQGLGAIFESAGGRLLIGLKTDLEAVVEFLERHRGAGSPASIGIAWEILPSTESLKDASAVLFAARELLGLVRLHGGGPEQREQDGLGVGSALADLALSRYTGSIVLCPSSPASLPRWTQWLASRKSAGCGSKIQTSHLELDVREVEPRDRLDTILGAYRSLARGATMQLTVDHDPSCMYYTLQATEAEGSFSFRSLDEKGPVVWRAEVTKL